MEHVDVDGGFAREQPVESVGGGFDGNGLVCFAPVIEPTFPKLSAHAWAGGTEGI